MKPFTKSADKVARKDRSQGWAEQRPLRYEDQRAVIEENARLRREVDKLTPKPEKKERKPIPFGALVLMGVLAAFSLFCIYGFFYVIAANRKPNCYAARRCERPWRGWELHERKGFWIFQVEEESILGENFKTEDEVRAFMKKWWLRECAE